MGSTKYQLTGWRKEDGRRERGRTSVEGKEEEKEEEEEEKEKKKKKKKKKKRRRR
jgi:hypothetical protein